MKRVDWVIQSLAALLIGGGAAYLAWQQAFTSVTLPPAVKALQQPAQQTTITRVQVPAQRIDVVVAPGIYDPSQQQWVLQDDKAFSMVQAKTPLVYGHDTPRVFGRLSELQPGAEVFVSTATQQNQRYSYVGSYIVAPTDVTILDKTMPNTLLLLSCAGVFSENRQVFIFQTEQETP